MVLRIRSLKIQQRRRRGARGGRTEHCYHGYGINKNNLIVIKRHAIHPTKNLVRFHLGCGNLRSIRNKVELLHDHITKFNYDEFVITETWLKNTVSDEIWIHGSALNLESNTMHTINRKGNKIGGGIALVIKSIFSVKLLQSRCDEKMEYGLWSIKVGNTELKVLGMYHPPGNNGIFMDDFTQLVGDIKTKYKNVIIAGDFNLHVNDNSDPDAAEFLDILDTLGFTNDVQFPTHKNGNTLDLESV